VNEYDILMRRTANINGIHTVQRAFFMECASRTPDAARTQTRPSCAIGAPLSGIDAWVLIRSDRLTQQRTASEAR
jgi:hypothetical protein